MFFSSQKNTSIMNNKEDGRNLEAQKELKKKGTFDGHKQNPMIKEIVSVVRHKKYPNIFCALTKKIHLGKFSPLFHKLLNEPCHNSCVASAQSRGSPHCQSPLICKVKAITDQMFSSQRNTCV